MSREGVAQAVERIAEELVALAVAVLEDDAVSTNVKTGRNTLEDSRLRETLRKGIGREEGGDPVMGVLFAHYVVYLEWSRPPRYGKQPPIGVLKEWAERRGIPTDAHTLWAISYAIWRDGHEGRPIFAALETLTDRAFTEHWADELFARIIERLDKLFTR